MNIKTAVSAINEKGVLLTFPINNKKEPPSLWSQFWPRSAMRWEWDEKGDNRVARLWQLREELSRSKKVVYAKWYQGRATFFSRDLFTAFLAAMGTPQFSTAGLNHQARQVLQVLQMDSPISTKQLKEATGLKGRVFEAEYHRALKELWSRFLIVGFGEVDEGAFPSLAIGATQSLFEDLWEEASSWSAEQGLAAIEKKLPKDSLFKRHFQKLAPNHLILSKSAS